MNGRKKLAGLLNKPSECNTKKGFRLFLNKKLKLVLVMLKSNSGL
jgi:hypothetical protein